MSKESYFTIKLERCTSYFVFYTKELKYFMILQYCLFVFQIEFCAYFGWFQNCFPTLFSAIYLLQALLPLIEQILREYIYGGIWISNVKTIFIESPEQSQISSRKYTDLSLPPTTCHRTIGYLVGGSILRRTLQQKIFCLVRNAKKEYKIYLQQDVTTKQFSVIEVQTHIFSIRLIFSF